MYTKATVEQIIKQVEKASGPDEKIDAAITALLNHAQLRPYPPSDEIRGSRWQFWSHDGAHFLGNEGKFKVIPVTESLEKAIGLIEATFPDWSYKYVREKDYTGFFLHNGEKLASVGPTYVGRGKTLALAAVSAFLNALLWQDNE